MKICGDLGKLQEIEKFFMNLGNSRKILENILFFENFVRGKSNFLKNLEKFPQFPHLFCQTKRHIFKNKFQETKTT